MNTLSIWNSGRIARSWRSAAPRRTHRGLLLTALRLTGYFTQTNRRPVKEIGQSSLTRPATVILSGVSIGLESAVYSALIIGAAVDDAFLLGTGNATMPCSLWPRRTPTC